MILRRRALALAGTATTAVLAASLALVGCSGEDDRAEVCTAVDSLKTSIADLTDVTIDQDTLTTLQDTFDEVQSDLREVKEDAGSEFGDEVDAVDQAASAVRQSLQDAAATPSAASVMAVGTAIGNLGASLSALEDALTTTC